MFELTFPQSVLPTWRKVLRQGVVLPEPIDVSCANSLPGPFLEDDNVWLAQHDVAFLGVSGYRRGYRAIRYRMYVYNETIKNFTEMVAINADKQTLRKAINEGRCHMPLEYMSGSGDLAALVRIVHGLRNGLTIGEFIRNCP